MKLDLLNKNKNSNILLAGIFAVIISIGVARFGFTSLLPSMLEGFLTHHNAGLLASANFFGYLFGAICTIFIKDINTKVRLFRLGIVLNIVTTLILATTTDINAWFVSRVLAGFGSAMVLIVGSAIVMVKLDYEDKTKAMGIHFSGIGFGITLTELLSQESLKYGTWQDTWMVLSLFALVISLYSVEILSFDKHLTKDAPKHKISKSMFTPYVILLILAYFTAGIGFVVQATFFPDIINSLEGLSGYGNIAWLVVGLAGIPSAIIWMRLAQKYGSLNMIIIAFILQIVGILIPTMTNTMSLNILSGALYGSTFIAHVALFMHHGGKLAGKNPVIFMGAMTAAYGIGQVTAPLYSVALFEKFANYDATLYLTAFLVSFGILFLLFAKKL